MNEAFKTLLSSAAHNPDPVQARVQMRSAQKMTRGLFGAAYAERVRVVRRNLRDLMSKHGLSAVEIARQAGEQLLSAGNSVEWGLLMSATLEEIESAP